MDKTIASAPAEIAKVYTYEEASQASIKYFGEELPAQVFVDKYALRDKENNIVEPTPDLTHDRLAREFARIDSEKYGLIFDERFKLYREAMDKFARIVPQGSPLAAIGNPYQIMSASNCVVIDSPHDSIAGIMQSCTDLAQLYKRRAGVGLDISTLRPDGFKVNNAARSTSGAWSFADLFSYITRMICMEGRRGALMITMDVHHPDVVKFATMKKDLKKVTGANISIKLSDEFLKAVEKDTVYEQRWPLEGNSIFRREVRAKEVWDVIVESATTTAEPGLIFWNRLTEYLPAHSYPKFKTISTNPCVTDDTWVLTKDGAKRAKDLINHKFIAIVNGEQYASSEAGFFHTGKKEVFEVKTKKGFEFTVTEDHQILEVDSLTRYCMSTKWTPLKELKVGSRIKLQEQAGAEWDGKGSFDEGWILGSLLGDGVFTKDNALLSYWGATKEYVFKQAVARVKETVKCRSDIGTTSLASINVKKFDRLNIGSTGLANLAKSWGITPQKHISDAVEHGSKKFYRGFLQGWFDADGSPQGNHEKGVSIRLSSIILNNLKIAHRMLARLGIISTIYEFRKGAGVRAMPDGHGGYKDYWCQANHELVISGESIIRFNDLIGFTDPEKSKKAKEYTSSLKRASNRERFVDSIVSITKIGEKDVYDCSISQVHQFDGNGVSLHNCSEIGLSSYDSCRLISINLTGYVKNAFTKKAFFDWDLFKSDIRLAVQMSDNLVDLELELIEKIKVFCDGEAEKGLWQKLWQAGHDGRRTGLGTHGLGDTFSLLNIRYDGDEALEMANQIYQTLRDIAYDTGVELAKVRGPFPVWDWKIDKDNSYIKTLPKTLLEKIKKHGRRNIAQLTQAPTGSISIISKCGEFNRYNISSGIEPVFRNSYIRRKKIHSVNNTQTDFKDALGDTWQNFSVFHANVKNWLEKTKNYVFNVSDEEISEEDQKKLLAEKLPDFFVTSDQIEWLYRVKLQGVIQKYIDHSISSTINLPKGTTSDLVGKIYLEAWKQNLKGITVYVDGSRDGVLITENTKKIDPKLRPEKITRLMAPKRPAILPCDIHHVTLEGKKWTAMIGLLNGEPYELFLGYSEKLSLPTKYKSGKLEKSARGKYSLHVEVDDDELVIKDVIETFNNPQSAWTTRLISMALRHGTPLNYIVEQLNKDGKINDLNKIIARLIKKYVKDGDKVSGQTCANILQTGDRKGQACNSTNLIYAEGCVKCSDCGYSKCN